MRKIILETGKHRTYNTQHPSIPYTYLVGIPLLSISARILSTSFLTAVFCANNRLLAFVMGRIGRFCWTWRSKSG